MWGPRLYLALLGVLGLVCCFLPLANHLGYEFAELVALAAGIFGAAPGIAAARREMDSATRALARALSSSVTSTTRAPSRQMMSSARASGLRTAMPSASCVVTRISFGRRSAKDTA